MNETNEAIEVNDPELLRVLAPEARVEQICTGFGFSEGPIWNPREQCLYFSDMPHDIRRRWTARDGVFEVRKPSNKCNGMTYDGAGNLYVCEHVTSSLIRETPAGSREVLATHWQGKRLNSPNDVVVRSDGTVYFTDPTYGRMPVFGLERMQELEFQGVYRLSRRRTLYCEAYDFGQPNGLCLSPDERTLYVNDTKRAQIHAFDVAPDGSLSRRRHLRAADRQWRPRRRRRRWHEVRRARQYLCHRSSRHLGVQPARASPGRDSDAGDRRQHELGRSRLARSLLLLFDVDLSRADAGGREPRRLHADGVEGLAVIESVACRRPSPWGLSAVCLPRRSTAEPPCLPRRRAGTVCPTSGT